MHTVDLPKKRLNDILVIRVRSRDRRAYLPFTFLPLPSIVDHVCNSDYQESPISHTRSLDEYIERVLPFFFFFLFFLVSVSHERMQRNCEKLTKCELWIRERANTSILFISPSERFFAFFPSASPPLFVALAKVACKLKTKQLTHEWPNRKKFEALVAFLRNRCVMDSFRK